MRRIMRRMLCCFGNRLCVGIALVALAALVALVALTAGCLCDLRAFRRPQFFALKNNFSFGDNWVDCSTRVDQAVHERALVKKEVRLLYQVFHDLNKLFFSDRLDNGLSFAPDDNCLNFAVSLDCERVLVQTRLLKLFVGELLGLLDK